MCLTDHTYSSCLGPIGASVEVEIPIEALQPPQDTESGLGEGADQALCASSDTPCRLSLLLGLGTSMLPLVAATLLAAVKHTFARPRGQ